MKNGLTCTCMLPVLERFPTPPWRWAAHADTAGVALGITCRYCWLHQTAETTFTPAHLPHADMSYADLLVQHTCNMCCQQSGPHTMIPTSFFSMTIPFPGRHFRRRYRPGRLAHMRNRDWRPGQMLGQQQQRAAGHRQHDGYNASCGCGG